MPTPLEQVQIVSMSKPAMEWLGMPIPTSMVEKQWLAERLSGNELFEGSEPFAHCYCGHQFGYFSGQLGDGRAISLGDIRAPAGDIVDL